MFHRGYRGSRNRSMKRPRGRTYKKVLHFVNASFSPGFTSERYVHGVDSVAIGQTSQIDPDVPTGAKVKYIEVQFAINNSVATPCYVNCTLQYTLAGQVTIDPNLVGGHAQRNQVLHMDLFTVGQDQNSTHKFRFKIPPKFQRMRESMGWWMVYRNSATINREVQVIYKVEL